MRRERSRTVKGFPDYYASENGYVVNKHKDRVIHSSPDKHGYMTIHLCNDGIWYTKLLHRVVAETFLGQPNSDAWQVNHINGDKSDNRLSNLEFVTPSENMYHAYANGLNHWEGYNESPVRIIETGEVYKSQAECARAIRGSQSNINACLKGRRSKHLGYHYEYVD